MRFRISGGKSENFLVVRQAQAVLVMAVGASMLSMWMLVETWTRNALVVFRERKAAVAWIFVSRGLGDVISRMVQVSLHRGPGGLAETGGGLTWVDKADGVEGGRY